MNFVYFDSVCSYRPNDWKRMYGYHETKIQEMEKIGAFKGYDNRFEKTFLQGLRPNEPYMFIIVSPSEDSKLTDNEKEKTFPSHVNFHRTVKEFGMEPYLVYQSPHVFMNRNVDRNIPRLMLYVFCFDQKYVDFAKGFVV